MFDTLSTEELHSEAEDVCSQMDALESEVIELRMQLKEIVKEIGDRDTEEV